jgi:hypothetical protein
VIEADAAVAAAVPVTVHADPQHAGPPLAAGVLSPRPSGKPGGGRLTARLVVPPRSFGGAGPRHISPLVVAGSGDDSVAATVPLPLTDAPVDVALVERGPRFEWRFLERLLAADATFAPHSVMLSAAGARAVPHAAALPRTADEWSRYDVAVIGDVPFGDEGDDTDGSADGSAVLAATATATAVTTPTAAGLADALELLGIAAARDGVGVVWLPGRLWRESPGDGPGWLPVRAAAGGGRAADVPLRLRPLAVGRDAEWLPWSRPGEAFAPEVFSTAGPVVLAPTARVLAVAEAEGDPAGAADRTPAIVLDRRDSAHVLVHLCETWRWRRTDMARYRDTWRRNLLRLAEPHALGRLVSATLAVDPPAPAAGDAVRIVVTPTRSGTDLTGWSLVVSSAGGAAGAAGAAAETVHPLAATAPSPGRPVTVTVAGLPAGTHLVRLVPGSAGSADSVAAAALHPEHVLVVGPQRVERAGEPAGTAAVEAATAAVDGTVVPLDRLASLPEAVEAALERISGGDDAGLGTATASRPADSAEKRLPGAPSATAARDHWLMGLLVVALAAAWWPAETLALVRGGADARG